MYISRANLLAPRKIVRRQSGSRFEQSRSAAYRIRHHGNTPSGGLERVVLGLLGMIALWNKLQRAPIGTSNSRPKCETPVISDIVRDKHVSLHVLAKDAEAMRIFSLRE